ncbi:hypothetical protein BU24DRAFT_419912 [Aaosphaeria arxii CBS 175.79]|uniref:Uncharacterized protein n=1 Tax=Aaosphaeria arxii CBS 175.79 TaxID=1450172 RepID=A0A6A5XVX6_9PLEO|nr:uncharacterized protein BU24DRAFT_419912 [Aaosphaeria arxii CBS 175.79]KAF2016861.1 hypothetical protein BU24DRAFT_419912 [Aaosphaeria arxii CBS 175.79]
MDSKNVLNMHSVYRFYLEDTLRLTILIISRSRVVESLESFEFTSSQTSVEPFKSLKPFKPLNSSTLIKTSNPSTSSPTQALHTSSLPSHLITQHSPIPPFHPYISNKLAAYSTARRVDHNTLPAAVMPTRRNRTMRAVRLTIFTFSPVDVCLFFISLL